MSPFRQACYAAGLGEFAVQDVDVRFGRVTLVRVARHYPLHLPDLRP